MATLAEDMTQTLKSLADWTGDKIHYQGRSFSVITGPMVMLAGDDIVGSLPGKLYQRVLQKKDFPVPPPQNAEITINSIKYRVHGDTVEENLHWVVTLSKHGA